MSCCVRITRILAPHLGFGGRQQLHRQGDLVQWEAEKSMSLGSCAQTTMHVNRMIWQGC